MATDQEIRDAGFKYVPQQKYLLNPFELPEDQEPVINQGIVNTNAFTSGGGGNNFSVFNPDPNSIVNKKYKPNYDFRQDREINSKTFNPQPYGTGIESAQAAYNQANRALAQGIDPNAQSYGAFTGGTLTKLKDTANEMIMNNKEQYGAQGQYVDPYDPRYSSVTEAQKFMDNFPEYYTKPPPSKMEGLISMLPYIGPLTKGANFLKNQISPYLPVSRRSILENELGGKGIMVDNIGRIVQGEGAYDTAGNIMSGYNASRITADTFDKRIASLGNMTPEGRAKRTAAIEAAKADFLNAQKTTDEIYDFEKDEKEKKKDSTIIGRYLTKKKEKKAIKAAKDAKDSSGDNTYITKTSNNKTGNDRGNFNQNVNRIATANEENYQSAAYDSPAPSRNYSQHTKSGAYGLRKGGRAGYFYGGRVNFKNGGLASIL